MFKYEIRTIIERTVLWYMTFWGFAINYVIRMNINIAIVSMVKKSTRNTSIIVESECLADIASLKSNSTLKPLADVDVSINIFLDFNGSYRADNFTVVCECVFV